MSNRGLVCSTHQKYDASGLIKNWECKSDPVCVEFRNPVSYHQSIEFVQCGRFRKKGSSVPVGSEAQQNQIKAGELARGEVKKSFDIVFVFESRSLRIFLFASDAKNVFRTHRNF